MFASSAGGIDLFQVCVNPCDTEIECSLVQLVFGKDLFVFLNTCGGIDLFQVCINPKAS